MSYLKISFLTFIFLFFYFSSKAESPISDLTGDAGVIYDEFLLKEEQKLNTEKLKELTKNNIQEASKVIDELAFLLPKLDDTLYKGWSLPDIPAICTLNCDLPLLEKDILSELKLEKVLNQGYKKENHSVYTTIYKFKEFTSAYSAFTILHSGSTTRLKVGRNATETNNSINFWKDKYFVDIKSGQENDQIAKEFIILIAQEISRNIEKDPLQPVVSVLQPAIYKVQGQEKFCIGPSCCNKYTLKGGFDFDCNSLDLRNSGGIITSEYQINEKGKERISLVLVRYISKEIAESVFSMIKEIYLKVDNKDTNVDLNGSTVIIKKKENGYILIKQKGNLLAMAHGSNSKNLCEQILNLVPWPTETYKPTAYYNNLLFKLKTLNVYPMYN